MVLAKVNIAMLARNRLKLTRQALDSLWNTPFDEWNLAIIDDRSDEPTARLLSTYGATRNDTPMGTGELRNAVIAESERRHGCGDYLYLSDNDVVFTPRWLETLIDCYEAAWSRGCRVLGGVGHPYHQLGETLGVCSFNVRYAVHQVNAQPLQSMLMHWEVWDAFKPFCQTPVDRVCQSEDVAFTNRLVEAGFKLGVVSPALVVNTGITNSFGEKIPGWEAVLKEAPPGVIVE